MTDLDNRLETEKEREVFQKAYQLFSRKPDWVTFFREILGVSGVVRRNYTSRAEMELFEQTETYVNIQQMLTRLREGNGPLPENGEPKSLHDLLREEAYEHRTSINKLCISKLLRMIDKELVPEER
jgi:hypothetical protein